MHAGEWLTANRGHTCRATVLHKAQCSVQKFEFHTVVPLIEAELTS